MGEGGPASGRVSLLRGSGRVSLLPGIVAVLTFGTCLSAEAQATGPSSAVADTLTLERAVGVALERSPDVRAAAARADGAAADQRAAWGTLLPTATANATFSRADFRTVTFPAPEGSSERLDVPLESVRKGSSQGVNLRWDVLQGGRWLSGPREGAATRRAASLRLSAVERRTTAAVKRAYYEALAADRLAAVAERQLEERRRDLEVARRRYEIAAAERTDVLGAEIEVGTAELALLEARDAAEAARRALQAEMGVDPDETGSAVLREPPAPPSAEAAEALDVNALVERALATEPEMAALEAEVQAAAAAGWTARSRYLPDLSLSLGVQRSESLGPDGRFFVLVPSNRTTSFSLLASWTLFDGFQREREMAAAGMRERVAQADRTARVLVLGKEVRDMAEEVRSRSRRLALRERTVQLAERRVEMARERYRLGGIDYVQLLSAVDQLTQAERALTRERYDLLKAWADLEERVGDVF